MNDNLEKKVSIINNEIRKLGSIAHLSFVDSVELLENPAIG